jgi:glutamate dehydrogenase/leucine dehydrogenase
LGAKVVGIIDRDGGVMNETGFSMEEMRALFLAKDGNKLVADQMVSFDEINEKIWSLPAEIFVPAAASRLVSQEQVQQMIDAGLEVISPGANVPFADKEIFFGPIMEYTDTHLSLLPDFISNCGIARVFAYLMESKIDLPMEDKAIFNDTSTIIKKALQRTFAKSASKTKICSTAFEIALKQLI